MDDKTLNLLNRARDDDRHALDVLFERYRDPLRRALRRLLGDHYRARIADSEDAAHDAILSALAALGSFEYRGEGSFLAWLLKRAEHELLNRVKASKRQRRDPGPGRLAALDDLVEDPSANDSVAGNARQNETGALIRAAIDELPPKERDVIMLRQFFELDATAISAELDLPSASAARNLYARAQARLTMQLQRRGLDEDAL